MTTNSTATAPAGGQVDLTMMLVMHDAFRRDLAHLARAASRYRTGNHARRAAIGAGWELFKTALVFHHTGEDTDLWPRMRAHLADRPDDLALLQAMEDEHARIDPLLHAVDQALADPGHERLPDATGALFTALSAHLAHEEREALPLLSRAPLRRPLPEGRSSAEPIQESAARHRRRNRPACQRIRITNASAPRILPERMPSGDR